MRIQHNIMAMNAYRNYTNNTSALSKNLEKLSSGYKINRAGDDAAGLAISEKMRAQITGLNAAQKNAKDGVSLVKTAEGALSEVHDMLNRMTYLATQSANGTYDNDTDRDQLQKEMDQLREEINRIADSSNFNGIKLLDGSMGGVANSIKIEGVEATKINAEIGTTTSVASVIKNITYGDSGDVKNGDTISYTVGLDNGKSYTATINLVEETDPADSTKKNLKLVDANTGKTLDTIKNVDAANGSSITAATIGNALAKALKNTDLANDFKISWETNHFKFENLNAGKTTVPQIRALDYRYTTDGEVTATLTADQPTTTGAIDEGYAIDYNDIVLYDGTNKDEAIFTINGKKFVLMTPVTDANTDAVPSSAKDLYKDYMHAVAGLGSDVTVLISDRTYDGNAGFGLIVDDANFQQNIDKIKELTGLNVEAYDDNGIYGIKLSLGGGKAATGLKLQIGDTADSYNQLNVSINDCHTKALGIDAISIADQESAATAVDAIKAAINYVSDVRGTLGATQNRLEHTMNNLSVMTENITDAESTIRDTDVAEEMMSYVKNNILVQSAQAMLAQANQVPQGVLQLLG